MLSEHRVNIWIYKPELLLKISATYLATMLDKHQPPLAANAFSIGDELVLRPVALSESNTA